MGAAVTSAPTGRVLPVLPLVGALLLFCVFTALGTWQVERRQWKHELIARVAQRVHAAAVAAPGPQHWPSITAQSDEYRHVVVNGTYLHDRTVLVQAVTELGAGFWMLTPLRTDAGWLVLVNRGFVASRAPDPVASQAGAAEKVHVAGLLRMTEPGGAFLRENAPAAGRWYSRDVAAIAAARGLQAVAPYFIDVDAVPLSRVPAALHSSAAASAPEASSRRLPASADTGAGADADAGANPGRPFQPVRSVTPPGVVPIPGLTVIAFSDNHLVYALTWYALALMVAGSAFWLRRAARREPQADDAPAQQEPTAAARRRQYAGSTGADKGTPEHGSNRKTEKGRTQ